MAVNKKRKIPPGVRTSLWFAHAEKLDLMKNRALVITQVLNRGTWEAVRWVFRTYGEKAIRQTVSRPPRGLWFPQTLHFWSHYFNIPLAATTTRKALFRLSP